MRLVIFKFYDRVFDDLLIGYLFQKVDKSKLVDTQLEFTQSLLGEKTKYQGRSIKDVHQPLKLRPAQFMRRQKILAETLFKSDLAPELQKKWLELEDRLKGLVLTEASCDSRI
jgi:hemoglobin